MSQLDPKKRIVLLNQVQDEAVEAVRNNGYNGVVQLPTGSGKTIILLKTLIKALEDGIVNQGDEIWILAEEIQARRKTFFEDEIPKFKEIFGHDILVLVDLKFYSYVVAPRYYKQFLESTKEAPKFIFMDEVECMMTPLASETLKFQEHGVKMVGVTGTLMATKNLHEVEEEAYQSEVFTRQKKVTRYVNKGQLFQMFLPVVYFKSIDWFVDTGLLSPIETTIIYHKLSDKVKVEITKGKKATKKTKAKLPWMGSEYEYWEFWNRLGRNPTIEATFRTRIFQQLLPQFLYTQPSKTFIGKRLVEILKDRKVLFFSPRIESLKLMDIPVAEDVYEEVPLKSNPNKTKRKKVKTVSDWLNEFDEAESIVLGSSKRLQRGVTLGGIDTLVIFLSGKSNTVLCQALGRIRRWKYGKIGQVFIIVTKGTYEERWLEEAQIIRDYKGKEIGRLDLNIVKEIPSTRLWD